ncbi:MAG: GNAT family N-acetyltransferase [Clostridia bacterium]|nr:GNAT family N-acetyltransferase [Clostridia bacterium]
MEIRRAEHRDIGRINALLEQVLRVHHDIRPDLFRESGKKYTDGELLSLMEDENTPIFVAVEDGVVQGYAFCAMLCQKDHNILTDVKTLYLDDLCVDEAVRGGGIGRALYAFVREYARQQGCYNVTLNVWEGNERAMHFYRSLGLSPQKTYMEERL